MKVIIERFFLKNCVVALISGGLIGASMSCVGCYFYKNDSDKKLQAKFQNQHFTMMNSLTSLYKCCQEYQEHREENRNIGK